MNEALDIGAKTIDGGYFVKRGDGRTNDSDLPRGQQGQLEHVYTLKGHRSTIREQALKLIRNAKRKIFIASFRIGDRELADALSEAAQRLRGGVYIITALDPDSLKRGLSEIEEGDGIDLQMQKNDFKEIASNGIYVRGHASCHAKFMVVDNSVALVSSANLETRALTVTGENGFVVRNSAQTVNLARMFTRMWYEECVLEIAPHRLTVGVRDRRSAESPCKVQDPRIESGIVWTAGSDHFLLNSLQQTIRSARENLLLSTFSLNGMSDNPKLLLDPLREAVNSRGVKARCLVRVRNHFPGHRRDAETLQRMGVEVIGDDLNHAKGIIADDRAGVVCSANFDAQHGLTSGVEVGVSLLSDSDAAHEAACFFKYSMARSLFRFRVNPTHSELGQRLAVRWRKAWLWGNSVHLEADHHVWSRLQKECEHGPVLFQSVEKKLLVLLCNRSEFRLERDGQGMRLELTGDSEGRTSAEQFDWLLGGRHEEKGWGICPAKFIRGVKEAKKNSVQKNAKRRR